MRRSGRPGATFDECNFCSRIRGAGLRLAKVYLIHEGTHQEDSATGGTEQIFGGKRVGNLVRIEPWASVRDTDGESFGRKLERGGDVQFGVVAIAVDYGIDGGLAGYQGEIACGIGVKACGIGEFERGLLDLVDAREGGFELQAYTACGSVGQANPRTAVF
jgi:hypothetical protein